MVRTPFMDKNGLRRGAWSEEEDEKLRAYIQRYGHWNWRQLPKFAGLSRCGKSCRLRWLNYLKPGVKHGNYSQDEERLIIKLHEKFGNRWSLIAAKLPGRTDNEVKNYWHTRLKKGGRNYKTRTESATRNRQYSCVTSQNKEQEAENTLFNLSCDHPILESSTFSAETASRESSSDNSSLGIAPLSSAGTNWIAEDHSCFTSAETLLQESRSGDFWTEPFIADNVFNQDAYNSLSFQDWELEFLSPCTPSCEDTMFFVPQNKAGIAWEIN